MQTHDQSDLKSDSLRRSATLNLHPERVSDALFRSNLFFDPRDLLQVKYEMLRRVLRDGQPVGTSSSAFGFSRMSFSQLRRRFIAEGLFGLLPQTKGPQKSHKLSTAVLVFIEETLQAEPDLRTRDLPGRVKERFGTSIHLRSIERALVSQRKKVHPAMSHHTNNLSHRPGLHRNVCFGTNSCAARRWSQASFPVHWLWRWRSLGDRDCQPGLPPTGITLHLHSRTNLKRPSQWTHLMIWFWCWQNWL